MDLWNSYTHCFQDEDLDGIRVDAQQLIRGAHAIGSLDDPIPHERHEPVPLGPTIRLAVDPAEMVAACALRAGQSAREMGRLHVAHEMFRTILIHFPQSRYQYYAAQARLGLERLDALSRAALRSFTL